MDFYYVLMYTYKYVLRIYYYVIAETTGSSISDLTFIHAEVITISLEMLQTNDQYKHTTQIWMQKLRRNRDFSKIYNKFI